MARITQKDAARALRQVVKDYGPDIRYSDRDKRYWGVNVTPGMGSCRYVNKAATPMCIVGVALVKYLGVDPNNPLFKSNEQIDSNLGGDVVTFVDAIMTPGAVEVFQKAQNLQDADETWGDAVTYATAGIR